MEPKFGVYKLSRKFAHQSLYRKAYVISRGKIISHPLRKPAHTEKSQELLKCSLLRLRRQTACVPQLRGSPECTREICDALGDKLRRGLGRRRGRVGVRVTAREHEAGAHADLVRERAKESGRVGHGDRDRDRDRVTDGVRVKVGGCRRG